jgi:3-hydroxyacyl-[acyl-carrier-protein] dehydratase
MLQGILYETMAVDAAGATVRLLPESPVYQGHFPGYPITPGVCLVEIALELIAEMADQAGHDDRKVGHDRRVRLVGAKNIKFTSPIIPTEGTELRFNLGGEGSERTVEILSGDTLCAKMSLTVA